MNEVLKYNNNFNNISLRNFNANELDILMAICSRMKEKGEKEITFHFDKLKKLVNYSDNTSATFIKNLESTYDKLISIKLKVGDERRFIKFVLFTRYSVDVDEKTVEIAVNKEFAFYEIPFKLDVFDQEKFKQSKIDFYVVMTNVENGQAEYVLIKDVFEQMEYLRATSALPFASKIIEINGKKYLDGGISDSIPIDYCRNLGYDKIIVILTRPENTHKEDKLNFLYKLVYRKYPNLVERLINMGKDYEVVLKKIKDLENENKIFVIRPPEVLKIGRLEKNEDKIQNVYDIGLNTGIKEIDNLLNYLNK